MDEPTLPRPNDDPDRLNKLRDDARKRLDAEARQPEYTAPVTVYGGPPPLPLPQKSWTVRGLLILAVAVLFGFLAWIVGRVVVPMPVYGGPPLPGPQPPASSSPNPVYGGPPPPAPQPQKPPPQPKK